MPSIGSASLAFFIFTRSRRPSTSIVSIGSSQAVLPTEPMRSAFIAAAQPCTRAAAISPSCSSPLIYLIYSADIAVYVVRDDYAAAN
ncbi:hypothetical protein BDW66DRAFT_133107 [Aspergillus desertorum]